MTVETTPCEWFALCDRVADGLRAHPILGAVPVCERCAGVVGEPITSDERQALASALEA